MEDIDVKIGIIKMSKNFDFFATSALTLLSINCVKNYFITSNSSFYFSSVVGFSIALSSAFLYDFHKNQLEYMKKIEKTNKNSQKVLTK